MLYGKIRGRTPRALPSLSSVPVRIWNIDALLSFDVPEPHPPTSHSRDTQHKHQTGLPPRVSLPGATQRDSPCCLSQPRSWMKPIKGAIPVPGPIMRTGVLDLKGRRNWDFRTYMGTVDLCPFSLGCLFFSQLVATPLFSRPVLVLYSTTTAQMWMEFGWTCRHEGPNFKFQHTRTNPGCMRHGGNEGCFKNMPAARSPLTWRQWSSIVLASGAAVHTGGRWGAAGRGCPAGWPECSFGPRQPSLGTATA